jgi:hypothetical protein
MPTFAVRGTIHYSLPEPEVIQVLDAHSLLVRRQEMTDSYPVETLIAPELLFRVSGVPDLGWTDGAKLGSFAGWTENFELNPAAWKLIYLGPWTYANAANSTSTIQNYALWQQITRAQFVEALDGGLELVHYRQQWDQIVRTPVP